MILFRLSLAILALAMVFFGVIVMIAPTPFGFVFVILGFLLLASVAPAFVRGMRKYWRWFDRKLSNLEKRSPRWIAKILHKTAPDAEERDAKDRRESRRVNA